MTLCLHSSLHSIASLQRKSCTGFPGLSAHNDCLEKGIFPTFEGLATYLGVGTRTLYDWELEHADFSQTMEKVRDTQRQLLITNGLTGSYNTRFAMFLLKANHGMSEKDPLISATQNSYMNISPDLLADALELMHSRETE